MRPFASVQRYLDPEESLVYHETEMIVSMCNSRLARVAPTGSRVSRHFKELVMMHAVETCLKVQTES